jgi:glucose-6-phosphate isomerase
MLHFTSKVNLTRSCTIEYAKLQEYTTEIKEKLATQKFNFNEASLQLPLKPGILDEIQEKLHHIDLTKLQYIFLIGIGGSNLGTKAVYSALWKIDSYKTIIFLDTINQQQSDIVTHIIDSSLSSQEDFCVVTVSKSGTTYETLFLQEVLTQKLEKKFGNIIYSRFITISDNDSQLTKDSKLLGKCCFSVPQYVGGRFSVLSTVGLVPLYLAGFNCVNLLKGGEEYVNHAINDSTENASTDQAVELINAYKNGSIIHNLFLFSPALESMGSWYRQLLSESIGKRVNQIGETVSKGIYPIISLGTTDLHSQAQLYFNGNTKNVFTTFVSVTTIPKDISLKHSLSDSSLLTKVYDGVQAAYNSNHLCFNTIALDSLDEYHLGLFFVQAELMIMYLAKLLTVNAFDQPEVELYKQEVRKLI